MQLGLPVDLTYTEVLRERSLGGAIGLCAKAAGLEPKQVQDACSFDKAQYSRWESGTEGLVWPKLERLMQHCGNDAPVLWMLGQRGYQLESLRKTETENERLLREAREENAALRRVLQGQR
jgi:Helix-turn-helix domain